MNKNILSILFLLFATTMFAGSIDILGVTKTIDTLSYKSVGPGAMYAHLYFPEYPMSVYMMTIDMENSYNRVETFQASNQAGKTEAMTNAYNRLSLPGHKAIGSINGNFWIVPGQGQPDVLLGVPHSGSVLNGEMITDPNGWNRGRGATPEELLQDIGFAVIDENRKAWIDDMGFDGKVTIDGGDYPISEINRIRKTDELVFFNSYVGPTTRTDDNGTEVFIKPVTGSKWSVNQDINCIVTRIVKDKGSNLLEAGESVLSGNGKAKQFLETLLVGQTIKVNMGIYTMLNKERPIVEQMLTGNALVMKNGVLTNRNYNEEYNSQLYPRTGIGMSEDGKKMFLIVIDKYSPSIGASTATMCGILKSSGAYSATSMDGGGSAQMMLNGLIMNKPADGKERAVANGWMLFQNAPEDNQISRIEFDNYKLEVPIFASFNPVIVGYNQYGVLINQHVEGFTLTCSPEVGSIKTNEIFVANSTTQSGTLTATYNGVSVTKRIQIVDGIVNFRLDSILIDSKYQYPIEVLSKVGAIEMVVSPADLEWIVENPSICTVENGILKGLSNGKTLVFGYLGALKDSLLVHVEIPTSGIMIQDNFSTPLLWKLTAQTNWNASLSTANLPTAWQHGCAINYQYQSNRAPSIKLAQTMPMYSLPDTLKIVFNTGAIELSKLIVSLKPNNQTQSISTEFINIPKNIDTQVSITVNKLIPNASDIASYPIWFDYMTFYIKAASQIVNTNYTLAIKEISLCYTGFIISSYTPGVLSKLKVYPNPVVGNEVRISLKNALPQVISMQIYTVTGQLIRADNLGIQQMGDVNLPLPGLQAGTYFLKIYQGKTIDTIKIIKR